MMDRVLSGEDPAEAYTDAGLAPVGDPAKKANSIMKKDQNQAYMAKILDECGATDEKIAKTLAKGMDANKIKYRKVINKVENEEGKMESLATLERLEEPDMPERRQSAMAAAELKGHRATKGESAGPTVIQVFNEFSPIVDRTKDVPEGLVVEVANE